MKQEIKDRWVAALRSGDYTQGRGTLRTKDDEFCCLGVLCDLAVQDGLDVRLKQDEVFGWEYDGINYVVPDSVMEWAGLPDANPVIPSTDRPLAGLNDGDEGMGLQPWSFEEIADAIEAEL